MTPTREETEEEIRLRKEREQARPPPKPGEANPTGEPTPRDRRTREP